MADIKTIGIVGAGQMGNGIAHVCALAGYDIILNDLSQDALDQGIATIEKNMMRQVARDLISVDEMKTAQARIQTVTDVAAFDSIDLAIEAATENREIKEKIFAGLCKVVPRPYRIGDQYIVNLGHPARFDNRSPGKIHRPALHEPGATDAADGDHSRSRHRSGDL